MRRCRRAGGRLVLAEDHVAVDTPRDGEGHTNEVEVTGRARDHRWAPGANTVLQYPKGMGMEVVPGSKLVLEIHYNTSSTAPSPDSTVSRKRRPSVLIPER